MTEISESDLKTKLFSILDKEDLSTFTKKQARIKLEEEFGLEKNGLKKRKREINGYLDAYLIMKEEKEDEADANEPDERPRKKARKEEEPEKEKKTPTFETKTRSGKEAPKKLKDLQSDLMTVQEFHSEAKEIKISLHGNELLGRPRSFNSSNLGW
eukprot:CAMPEP_0185270600 /NCGR_PEP_ID=MMETSP1359-20130426/42636_1 /TAXON_ID=552665 /ORGANISM="Bigelowiella longifila, Strain CCMP242" /LENGTH=155 /DNA_ID=CAMNT_0027862213 /DNA_START=88 /DNA_END=552 /DNA_ORIENTATION=+